MFKTILWFIISIGSFLLGMFYKKSNENMFNSKLYDGEVVEINPSEKEIKVQYTADGRSMQFAAKEDGGDFSRIKCGQKVLVLTRQGIPISVTYNINAKDRSLGGSAKAAFIISAVCLFMGAVSLFR